MNGAQITMVALLAAGFAINVVKHGEARTGLGAKHNMYVDLLSAAIIVLVLFWGGFWG